MHIKADMTERFKGRPGDQLFPSHLIIRKKIVQGVPKKRNFDLRGQYLRFKASIGESRTSFENCMFSAFIWAQEQVNYVQASLGKTGFKKLT